jgi:NDP-sugar pyrophosphorylase family protein
MSIQNKKIRAFILCGGRATRLKGLNGDLPKPLMKIHGEPIIAYLLRGIANLFQEIIICHAHSPSLYLEHLHGHVPEHILHSISYEKDTEMKGTAFAAQRYLPIDNNFSAVLNGDTLFSNYHCLIPSEINANEVIFSTSSQKIGRSNLFFQDPENLMFSVKQNRHGKSKNLGIVSNGLIFMGPDAVRIFKRFKLSSSESLELALFRLQGHSGLLFSNHSSQNEFLDFGTPAEFSGTGGSMLKFISNLEV